MLFVVWFEFIAFCFALGLGCAVSFVDCFCLVMSCGYSLLVLLGLLGWGSILRIFFDDLGLFT